MDYKQGHLYLIRTKTGQQKYERTHIMTYLGRNRQTQELQFSARPFAGTQELYEGAILEAMDLGLGKALNDPRHYMNRIDPHSGKAKK